MPEEIERKFLLLSDHYKILGEATEYIQGYMSLEQGRTIRVRIAGEKGFLTIKGMMKGICRSEFEYEIPMSDANEMLKNFCIKPLIRKIRYRIPFEGLIWEVDEFKAENQGLIVAEVELPSEDYPYIKPEWVGDEVSHEHRYANSYLVLHPFSTW